MGTSAIAMIIFAAAIPAVFFIYIGLRAYKNRNVTKNEIELSEVRAASQNKQPIDVGAQKR